MPEAPTTPPLHDRSIAYERLHDLKPAKRNPKGHDLPGIKASITRWGLTQAVASVDERTGRMVLGHGRRTALLELFEEDAEPPKGVLLDDDGEWLVPVSRGWRSRNVAEADGALIGDNELTIAGGWTDRPGLHAMLDRLGSNLDGTGWTAPEVEQLRSSFVTDDDEPARDRSGDGALLDVLDVSLGEPKHPVVHGEVWSLGDRHVLIAANVMREHDTWAPYLTPDTPGDPVLFCPYPGVFFPLAQGSATHRLVLVQPDLYLAGHLLDAWVAVHGEATLTRVTAEVAA